MAEEIIKICGFGGGGGETHPPVKLTSSDGTVSILETAPQEFDLGVLPFGVTVWVLDYNDYVFEVNSATTRYRSEFARIWGNGGDPKIGDLVFNNYNLFVVYSDVFAPDVSIACIQTTRVHLKSSNGSILVDQTASILQSYDLKINTSIEVFPFSEVNTTSAINQRSFAFMFRCPTSQKIRSVQFFTTQTGQGKHRFLLFRYTGDFKTGQVPVQKHVDFEFQDSSFFGSYQFDFPETLMQAGVFYYAVIECLQNNPMYAVGRTFPVIAGSNFHKKFGWSQNPINWDTVTDLATVMQFPNTGTTDFFPYVQFLY